MNRAILLFFAATLIISCSRTHTPIPGIPEIDVTLRFPEREINLTDIAYVTYVHLDASNDDFLYRGTIVYITENRIIVVDQSSGSVLFFSKEGTPISRFNRLGQGPGEYFDRLVSVAYDEATDEVFLFGLRLPFIQVYSSTGEHKRRIDLPPASPRREFMQLRIFDDQSLLMYDMRNRFYRGHPNSTLGRTGYAESAFFLICRTDGQIVYQIPVPASNICFGTPVVPDIVSHPDGFLLGDPAVDTIFLFCRNKTLTPILWRTPPVGSLNSEVFITNTFDSRHFQFFNIRTFYPWRSRYYIRDKQTGRIYRQNITLPDFQDRRFTIAPALHNSFHKNGTHIILDLQELKQAYRQNRLSGELKELVSTLCEWNSNDVFAFIRFK